MEIPRPEVGLVLRYNFLWDREATSGRNQARKARPCAIVTAVANSDGRTLVTVAPITHSSPTSEGVAIEIPAPIKRILGLDDDRSWIVTNELNTFGWPGPDVEPADDSRSSIAYGRLPRTLLIAVIRQIVGQVQNGRLKIVKRTE